MELLKKYPRSFNSKMDNNRYNKTIMFGDFFSDIGNGYALTNYTWPIDPTYYQSRSCEGPNWVDRLEVHEK
jgi:hypothetical protein